METSGTVPRTYYIERLASTCGTRNMIKVLTGPRDVGKRTILAQFADELVKNSRKEAGDIVWIDLADGGFADVRSPQALRDAVLQRIGERKTAYVMVCDVQLAGDWPSALADMVEGETAEFFLTSATDLSGTVKGTDIEGNVKEVRVYPLCLEEFMLLNGISDPHEAARKYAVYGGMPTYRADMDGGLARAVLRGTLCDILVGSAVAGGEPEIDRTWALLGHLMMHSGEAVDWDRLSEVTGKPRLFADKYLRSAVGSFAVSLLEGGEGGLRGAMKGYVRAYPYDVGLRTGLIGAPEQWADRVADVVYEELRRRGFAVALEDYGGKPAFAAGTPKGKVFYVISDRFVPEEAGAKKIFGGLRSKKRTLIVPDGITGDGCYSLADFLLGKDLEG